MSHRCPGSGAAPVRYVPPRFISSRPDSSPQRGALSRRPCGQSGTDTLSPNQRFLGQMLDTQRRSVSLVANTLQQAGLVSHSPAKTPLLLNVVLRDEPHIT